MSIAAPLAKTLFPLVLLSAFTLPASAQDCAHATTQTEMNQCAGEAFKRSDARLNAEYKTLMKNLASNPEEKNALRMAQRAWIVFRDAECDFTAAGSKGGSIYPLVLSTCLKEFTDLRADQLSAHMQGCPEGDITCNRN